MAKQTEESLADEMTFFEHLEDLRPHLMRAALALFVIAIVAFIFARFLVDNLLFAPGNPDFPTNRWLCSMGYWLDDVVGWIGGLFGAEWSMDPTVLCINQNNDYQIINTKLVGQFNLSMKVALITGLVIAIPYLLWEIWQFIKPALTERERRGTNKFVLWVSLGFFAGVLFGYYIIAPLSISFFATYRVSDNISNMIDTASYASQVIGIPLGTGLIFQLPLLIYFLTRIGIVNPDFLRKYRKHAVVLLAVIAAIITPPDLFSLILVTLPLYGLYELSIALSTRTWRKYHAEEETTEEVATVDSAGPPAEPNA
jgi:sec-independent protein translocase protein TatC